MAARTEYHETVSNAFTRTSISKTGRRYAMKGIPVFPLKGKAPLTPHGFKDASSELSRVAALFNAAPNATGIGMPTGGVSGLVVADKDRDSEEVRRIWDSLPPTLEVATGRASGLGRHG